MSAARSMRVADVVPGQRHRAELGDIEGLAASISQVGLLHPIVVCTDGMLIAGMRRLEAVKKLGWEYVAVTVVELTEIARGEHAENVERKDFTLTEAVAIKRALEPSEAAAAKKRQGTRTDKHRGKLPPCSVGKARDKVAKFTGFGARTLEKADAVIAAAETDPAKFGNLKLDMDRTGRVDRSFKRLKSMRQAEATEIGPAARKNVGPRPRLNSLTWSEATPQERFRFVDNVGAAAIENVVDAVMARYAPMPGFAKVGRAWAAASEADRERFVDINRDEIIRILAAPNAGVSSEDPVMTQTKAQRGL